MIWKMSCVTKGCDSVHLKLNASNNLCGGVISGNLCMDVSRSAPPLILAAPWQRRGHLKRNAMLTPAGLIAMPTAGRSADVFLSSTSHTQLPLRGEEGDECESLHGCFQSPVPPLMLAAP